MTLDDVRAVAAEAAGKGTDVGMSPRVALALAGIAEAAKALDAACFSPTSDSDGDGVWVSQVWNDCGECPACCLNAALAALEAIR